jgi:hypothetical protein
MLHHCWVVSHSRKQDQDQNFQPLPSVVLLQLPLVWVMINYVNMRLLASAFWSYALWTVWWIKSNEDWSLGHHKLSIENLHSLLHVLAFGGRQATKKSKFQSSTIKVIPELSTLNWNKFMEVSYLVKSFVIFSLHWLVHSPPWAKTWVSEKVILRQRKTVLSKTLFVASSFCVVHRPCLHSGWRKQRHAEVEGDSEGECVGRACQVPSWFV